MTSLIDELRKLYSDESKHSRYQSIPDFVAAATGYEESLNEEWRSDKPRYQLIKDWLPAKREFSLLDIGANTGFFSLSIAHDFPKSRVTACEVNATHAKFINRVIEHFGLPNISVLCKSADLGGIGGLEPHEIMLNMNVLHHAGCDFDSGCISSPEELSNYGERYLTSCRLVAQRLVFQMGYNWGGNKKTPIVPGLDHGRKLLFSRDLLRSTGWDIESIAVAEKPIESDPISYGPLPSEYWANNEHDEPIQNYLTGAGFRHVWSEFFRRPIFFCRGQARQEEK